MNEFYNLGIRPRVFHAQLNMDLSMLINVIMLINVKMTNVV